MKFSSYLDYNYTVLYLSIKESNSQAALVLDWGELTFNFIYK